MRLGLGDIVRDKNLVVKCGIITFDIGLTVFTIAEN